jgi:hypothetical protein
LGGRQRAGVGAGGRSPAGPTSSFFRRVGSRVHSGDNLLGLFRTGTGEDGTPAGPIDPFTPLPPHTAPVDPATGGGGVASSPRSSGDGEEMETDEVEMVVRMHIPADATPSHSVVPIIVSHRGELSASPIGRVVESPLTRFCSLS